MLNDIRRDAEMKPVILPLPVGVNAEIKVLSPRMRQRLLGFGSVLLWGCKKPRFLTTANRGRVKPLVTYDSIAARCARWCVYGAFAREKMFFSV